MASGLSPATTQFSLKGRPGSITLEDTGFRHPTGSRGGRSVFTPYPDITHLATSPRTLWIGTRRGLYVVPRSSFVDENGPENAVRALLERIARAPGGREQLARMAEVEETARTPGSLYATWGLAGLCAVVYAGQLLVGADLERVGQFDLPLAVDGDWWRFVTANLLHANTIHLLLNGLGLLAVGSLVERSIGTARTVCVIACSALGAMGASWLFQSDHVVGVSGVVLGLVGALCWLELRFATALPAWWRVPRGALFGTLAATALISLLPFVAAAAHAGGFLAGLLAAMALTWPRLARRPSAAWVRGVACASLAVAVAAIAAAGYELLRDGEYAARRLARLSRLENVSPDWLNNEAWSIAVDPGSSRDMLETALELAERAVEETDRQQAGILDTLAEVQFQLGNSEAALATIDEAIAQRPEDDYLREQRRRFLGERDADDRPPQRLFLEWGTPRPPPPPPPAEGELSV